MEKKVLNETQYDDELDIIELISVILAGKTKIISITIAFAIFSAIYALSIPNQYKAEALLAPAQSDNSSLSGALDQLGGLASLAGVNLDNNSTNESEIAREAMQSWSFIEKFIVDNNIEIEVYAAEGWIRDSNTLKIDADLYDSETGTWFVKNDNTGEVGPPSSWKLFESFSEMLVISEEKNSGLISVSIEYYSPLIAKQWVDMYVNSINYFMQQRQVAKTSRNIEYLKEQIGKTNIVEMEEVFYSIIEEQTKNKMLAEASPDYAFVAVGPSMVPEQKSQPQRALICILGSLMGAILSILWVLATHYLRKTD